MDMKEIRLLAELMKEMDLSKLEITQDGKTIKMESKVRDGGLALPGLAPQAALASVTGMPPATLPAGSMSDPAAAAGLASSVAPPQESDKLITSPMVGVFYASPTPDSKPFVSRGDRVKAGDVVCIIEAMKLMNEIAAERDGVISEILVKNEDVVEFGQPLFRLE